MEVWHDAALVVFIEAHICLQTSNRVHCIHTHTEMAGIVSAMFKLRVHIVTVQVAPVF